MAAEDGRGAEGKARCMVCGKTLMWAVSVRIVFVEGFLSVHGLIVMPSRKDLWCCMRIK